MSHHSTFNPMNWFANIFRTNHKGAYLALVLSITLTACGGSDDPAQDSSPEPGADGTAPTLSKVVIANGDTSCPSAKLADEVVISITASESIMKPSVTIGGVDADVTGQHHAWKASAIMTADVTDGVLPFDIAFADNSGEAGVNVTAATISSNEEAEKPDWATVNYCSDGSCIEPCFTTKVLDFEDTSLTLAWKDIGTPTGDTDPGVLSSVVDDPATDGTRKKVAKSSIDATGKAWRGAYVVAKDASDEVAFKLAMAEEDAILSMDVYGIPADTKMELKLEDAADNNKNVSASTFTQQAADEWETIYFDFSESGRAGGAIDNTVSYGAFFLMYGGNDGDKGAATWYWDNITHGNVQSPGPVIKEFADFSGSFGNAVVSGDTYSFPTGAEGWAGFANTETSFYPIAFENGGKVTFKGSLPSGGTATKVKFKFEKEGHPNTTPEFFTSEVTVNSETEHVYTVDIGARPAGETYRSFLMYVVDRDKEVIIKDVKVTTSPFGDFTGSFGNAVVDGTSYTFPSGAESWAGFANLNTNLFPFAFPNGGTITFTGAAAAGDVDVRFRFERLGHPDTEPSYNTDPVTVTGATEAEYTIAIPAQAAANSFRSFLMYLDDRDAAVTVKNVKVTNN